MSENKAQSGMTLVEILVAMVMMGIVITGVYNLFRVHNLMAAKQEETTLMQQELLSAMVQISEDLRMCGYTNVGSGNGFNATSNATIVICTKDPDLSSNSTIIGYRHNPGNNAIEYINATEGWEESSTNISNVMFSYFTIDGTNIPNINASEAGRIRAVDITLTAVASDFRSELNIGNRMLRTRVYCRNTGL